jgi:4-carboxymuconolactone decarboxylase
VKYEGQEMKRLHSYVLITAALITSACATASGNNKPAPLMIQEQGSLAVGGTVITAPGTFDPIKQGAYNPVGPDPAGQTLHGDHAGRSRQYALPNVRSQQSTDRRSSVAVFRAEGIGLNRQKEPHMKLLAVIVLFFSLVASASTQTISIARSGSQPSRPGPAENFTGAVRVEAPFGPNAPSRTSGALVTFEPGARSAWHSHPLGQTLIVTDGVGRVQQWGGPVEEIRVGDVIWTPPGVKHWHGASPTTVLTHIAIQESAGGKSVEWMEKVNEEQYNMPVRKQASSSVPKAPAQSTQPTPAQRLIGDFSPKLVELTDNVLFGDVWARPQLSPRDRSLVTVSALIAMNRPEQLRSHLARARDNGVTQEELVETITHLAFYAGWPSAMTAITVAKEVFENK